jgi:small subunit ribosomal protein S3
MARSEEFKEGKTPLHTFRSDIDYSWQEAQTVYGKIGIKTWICKGEVLGKRDLSPAVAQQASGKPVSGNNSGGGFSRGGNDRGGEKGGDRRDGNRRRGPGGNADGRNQRKR